LSAEPHAVLRAVGVTAGYGRDPVIRGVSVTARSGQVVSVVGPNGSGKTTLLKALTGALRITDGQVWLGDREVTNAAPEDIARAGVGYVPQVDDVFGPLTVLENLEMGGYLLARGEVPERVTHVLSVFPRLRSLLRRPAGKLSGGERKMLAMGRVLMLRPAVFLLDEPTANLAPAIARDLLGEQVALLAADGAAVLIVEQRARAVLAVSDLTYVMGGGELRMSGPPADLLSDPAFVSSFLGGRSLRPHE
jgi:ABC-type branched-subunit amino acid transport system ATPase component